MKIGFLGQGVMGSPMAINLLKGGHEVVVFARREEAAAAAVAAGASYVATPAEAAKRSDIVISMVTAGADVKAVALGPQGVIEGAAPGCVFVDMSTIAPGDAREVGAALAKRGIHMLDAPVSGGDIGAMNGTLSIMVGGDAAVLERVRPAFANMGQRVTHVGSLGAGQVAKACNQMLLVNLVEACAEAWMLAERSGVDFARVRDAMLAGSAESLALDMFGARMVQQDFRPGVQARLHYKDYGILLEAARGAGIPLPITEAVMPQMEYLIEQGWGHDDTSSLLCVLRQQHGAS